MVSEYQAGRLLTTPKICELWKQSWWQDSQVLAGYKEHADYISEKLLMFTCTQQIQMWLYILSKI